MTGFLCSINVPVHIFQIDNVHSFVKINFIIVLIIINTVAVMFDNYDWRMMLKLLGVSSYRRRIKADRRLKGGAKTMYVLVG